MGHCVPVTGAMLLWVPIPASIVLVFKTPWIIERGKGLLKTQPYEQMEQGQMDMPKWGPLASQHHSSLKCFTGECLSPANRHCQRERRAGNHTSFLESSACAQPQDTCIFGCVWPVNKPGWILFTAHGKWHSRTCNQMGFITQRDDFTPTEFCQWSLSFASMTMPGCCLDSLVLSHDGE